MGFAISHTKYLLVTSVDQRPGDEYYGHMWTYTKAYFANRQQLVGPFILKLYKVTLPRKIVWNLPKNLKKRAFKLQELESLGTAG